MGETVWSEAIKISFSDNRNRYCVLGIRVENLIIKSYLHMENSCRVSLFVTDIHDTTILKSCLVP